MKSRLFIFTLAGVVAALPPPFAPGKSVRYVGRVNPATKELSWPGTGVEFTFTGTWADIGLTHVGGTNSADLFIDGGEPIVISNVVGTNITTPRLSFGRHTVVLRRRSEPGFGSVFIGNITTDGSLGVDVAPKRQIEIIGDSISVGFGLDGTDPCTNTAAIEDNPKTYGALAAEALRADYNVVAWQGKGIVCNVVSTNPVLDTVLMPELWTRYGAKDPDNSYTFPAAWMPQAVVINLGTNDFGTGGTIRPPLNATAYTDATVSFAHTIQHHYPHADFFLMTSPMLGDPQHTIQANALKDAIKQLGPKAHFVEWPTQGSARGCGGHPNADTHAAEGVVLAAAIKTALGW
jgi:lysophospholipase L1-like esterase